MNAGPAEADPAEQARLEAFWDRLYAATPRTPVTIGLILLNVAAFLATLADGAGFIRPVPEVMLRWGAIHAPAVGDGELWRLLAHMFLHYGILHLAINMWALWSTGRFVERLYGNGVFFAITLFSGICGGLATLWRADASFGVGASGAIFGLVGAVVAFAALRKDALPRAVLGDLGTSLLVFAAFSIFIGVAIPGVDNLAHVGGFIGGFVAGAACARPAAGVKVQPARLVAATVAGIVVLGAVWAFVPPPPYTLSAERAAGAALAAFLDKEGETVKAARMVLDPLKRGELSEVDAADRLEREVVPKWDAVHRELAAIKLSEAAPSARELQLALRYTAVRREILTELAGGLRHNDKLRLEHANALAGESRRLLEQFGKQRRRGR